MAPFAGHIRRSADAGARRPLLTVRRLMAGYSDPPSSRHPGFIVEHHPIG
jgi:hypothetical protein